MGRQLQGATARTTWGTLLLCLVAIAAVDASPHRIVYTSPNIPTTIPLSTTFLLSNSDTLQLNGYRLVPDVDYTFDRRARAFTLRDSVVQSVSESDTLVVIYTTMPEWLTQRFGRPLPSVRSDPRQRQLDAIVSPSKRRESFDSDISISGAKTFRFSARTAGASDFGQSLDLNVSGNLTPGVEIVGTISDRGYDPAYGTANSRLSELDRVNLTLRSTRAQAQIGDISIAPVYSNRLERTKRVSGASVEVDHPRYHLDAVAARPKGRFESVQFRGFDGLQGPYQINGTSRIEPVVPGSEVVFLDGELIERGANEDYVVDYATGQITFNVSQPIDSRSRIEIDFEPLSTDFEGELFVGGGGVASPDSTIFAGVSWVREGDDREQPLAGEFSQSELDLLGSSGDNALVAVRSGVVADTAGDYMIVADSLPDTVFVFVGQGNGNLTISFGFIGKNLGAYRFIGGGEYRYFGPGNGDFDPVVQLPLPERTDYYAARAGVRNTVIGELVGEIQQTDHDRNLYSAIDDADNQASMYSLTWGRSLSRESTRNLVKVALRKREADFDSRGRIYGSDFARSFMLPNELVPRQDEWWFDAQSVLVPAERITLRPQAARVTYTGGIESNRGGVDGQLDLSDRITVSSRYFATRARRDSGSVSQEARADQTGAAVSWQLADRVIIATNYEFDRRTNSYTDTTRGTRYNRVGANLTLRDERLEYEYHIEDSLATAWTKVLERNRLSLLSNRQLGRLGINSALSYQWLTRADNENDALLIRTDLNYSHSRKKLSVGGSYLLSEEARNTRGLTYIEVAPGQGQYRFEDGRYVPDADGNFLEVEEILSDQSDVRRAEKTFFLNKSWDDVILRLSSNVSEELLPEGDRSPLWVLPFWTDASQPYLFFSRRYNGDIRIVPIRAGHAVSVIVTETQQIRDVADSRRKRQDIDGSLTLRQIIGETYLRQEFEGFTSTRDEYFNGGGDVDGAKMSATVTQRFESHEISGGGGYRWAQSDARDEVNSVFGTIGARLRYVNRGDIRTSVEVYSQNLTSTSGVLPYRLTDDRFGKRGAIWSVAVNYNVKGGVRVNINLSGRHSDDRRARVFGRGEVVTTF